MVRLERNRSRIQWADIPPQQERERRGRCRIADAWTVEEGDERSGEVIALCAEVEVAESVRWCSRGRGSRGRDAEVDVESGWPVSR